jgi:hypothetical protein
MNLRKARFALVAHLALLVASQAACMVSECNDCGECGFVGGPNQGDSIGRYETGADPKGVPTVELVRYREGECAGAGGNTFWVRFEGGAIAVVPAAGELDLDAATRGPTAGESSTYTFHGPGVTVTIELAPDGHHIAFNDGTTKAAVRCALAGEDAIACAPDPAP